MPLDPSVAKYWGNIESGLDAVQVTKPDRDALQDFLSRMSVQQQLAIVQTGDKFGLLDNRDDKRRNLARVMNLALGLSAYYRPRKIAYQLNGKERESILKSAADLNAIQAKIKREVELALENANTICHSGTDAKGVMPVIPDTKPHAITIDMAVISTPPLPVSRDFDALERVKARQHWGIAKAVHKEKIKDHKMNIAVEALTTGGAARGERVADFVQNNTAVLIGSWTTALGEVKDVFTNHKDWLMFNFITMEAAIGDAYKNFEINVKENQKDITDKLNILTMMFGALKHGPFPVSLVGNIGEKAMGVFKADEGIDPRSSVPLLVGTSSGFISNLKDKLDDKYQELSRVGPKLASIDNVSDWRQGLHIACDAQLKCLKDLLTLTCNEYFGDSSSVVQKFEAMRDSAVKERYGEIKGRFSHTDTKDAAGKSERELVKQFVIEKITNYKKEQIAAMEKIFCPKMHRISPAELQRMVEMTLYSQYITLLYKDDNACCALPLAEKIVDFFADASTWGILMKAAHHSESEAQNRLNWKQSANNRKALVMFCKWYLRDVNPFVMVIGGKVNGKVITPSIVRTMCADEVKKINAAIKHGRKTSKLGSSWDWEKINLHYSLH